ncbi:hypothetical protein RQP46_010310 [Phenoliferia psychrophenolica]
MSQSNGPSKSMPPSDLSTTLGQLDLGFDDDNGLSSDSDDEHGASSLPTFKLPASPPQLDSLTLPSPIFGRSFVDLLEPLPASPPSPSPGPAASTGLGLGAASTRAPSRLRSGSAVSRTSPFDQQQQQYQSQPRQREPTLIFSNPRAEADRRVRKEGATGTQREEEPFIGAFPDHDAIDLGVEAPSEWIEEEWIELASFLARRGYKIEGEPAGSKVLATRQSDNLKLFLRLVPIDDISYELDVVEHLASAGVRSAARAHGVIAAVPTVGIIPVSEDWTAVFTERWSPLASVDRAAFPTFARDVVGAVSFLHSNHIAHLSLSPASVAHSTALARWTLTSFVSSIQGDPLAKRPTKVTGLSLPNTPPGYGAPEMSDDVPYDPFAVDLFALGKILQNVAVASGAESKDLQPLLDGLTLADPKARTRPAAAMAALKALYP